MKPPIRRPDRHRIAAIAYRLFAAAVFIQTCIAEPMAKLADSPVILAVIGGALLLAVFHDLVAATLRPKVWVCLADSNGLHRHQGETL
jgi:hypothetical protein